MAAQNYIAYYDEGLISVQGDAVVCSAIYPEGGKVIVRLYESKGRNGSGRIRLNLAAGEVVETDAMGENCERLSRSDGCVELKFRAFEIKTLVVSLGQ